MRQMMTQYPTLQYTEAKFANVSDIPVIDLKTDGVIDEVETIATLLIEAASETGFFYVSGHGVPVELCNQAMRASRSFFELPESTKTAIAINQHQRGWMRQGLPSRYVETHSDSRRQTVLDELFCTRTPPQAAQALHERSPQHNLV